MVCNGFLHRLHVVRRRVDERRARRPTKIAGVCGFSAVAILMEGCHTQAPVRSMSDATVERQ